MILARIQITDPTPSRPAATIQILSHSLDMCTYTYLEAWAWNFPSRIYWTVSTAKSDAGTHMCSINVVHNSFSKSLRQDPSRSHLFYGFGRPESGRRNYMALQMCVLETEESYWDARFYGFWVLSADERNIARNFLLFLHVKLVIVAVLHAFWLYCCAPFCRTLLRTIYFVLILARTYRRWKFPIWRPSESSMRRRSAGGHRTWPEESPRHDMRCVFLKTIFRAERGDRASINFYRIIFWTRWTGHGRV